MDLHRTISNRDIDVLRDRIVKLTEDQFRAIRMQIFYSQEAKLELRRLIKNWVYEVP